MGGEVPTESEIVHILRARLAASGWRSVLLRTLLLACGWWVIVEGDLAALPFGLPVVLLALGASVLLSSPRAPRWSPPGLLRFGLAFLAGSLQGGLDVARRALAPRLRLSPALVRYPLRLPPGPARHLFMSSLSLMPGTLGVQVHAETDVLEIHVLVDRGDEIVRQLRALEVHVGRAAGEPGGRSRA